jgi:hypothetical protein
VATLADAFVKIKPDMAGFGPTLKAKTEAEAGPAGKATGKTFGAGMMTGIGGVLAAGAIIGFFKGAFSEAQEAAKVTKLTEAVIKSTGGAANVTAGEINKLADRLSGLAGVDDEVIVNGANVLLTFTKVRNEAGKGNDIFNQATAAALNLSAALGTDLQAANILVGKALNDPIKGLTALGKAGIQFTQAQKDQIKTMVAAGDTMGAQKIILKELETQFGGAAAAAASPADKARVAWGNFQEMVGTRLLPALNQILTWGVKNQGWLVPLVGALAALGVVIGVVMVATKAWVAIQAIVKVATTVWTGVQWLLNVALTANPVGIIIVAIAALIAIIILIATKTTWFQTLWRVVWTFVKDVALAVAHWFAGPFAGFFVNAFNRVKAIVVAVAEDIHSKWSAVINFFSGLPGRIFGFFSGLASKFNDLGRSIVEGIINGISNMIGGLVDKAKEMASKAWNAAKNAIGFGSPAKRFIPLGKSIGQAFVVGMDSTINAVRRAMARLGAPPGAGAMATASTAAGGGGAGTTINVYGSAGQSVTEIVAAVQRELDWGAGL